MLPLKETVKGTEYLFINLHQNYWERSLKITGAEICPFHSENALILGVGPENL